jgi:HAD superfamily hydrolase (TIGR01509 family)
MGLVIFDLDGVLVDSEPVVNRLFVELVGRDGIALDVDATLARFSGAALASRVEQIIADHGWEPPPEFLESFLRRLTTEIDGQLKPVAGVEAVLAGLRIPWCVASNGTRDEVEQRLRAAGLSPRFSPRVFSAVECPRPKPHPDVFLHAASAMGFPAASCSVVEDSLPGVQAAVAAGMRVFAYAGLRRADELARLGARVFTDMAELPLLLE